MVDMVVSRLELKPTIARLLKMLLKTPAQAAEPEILPAPANPSESRPQA